MLLRHSRRGVSVPTALTLRPAITSARCTRSRGLVCTSLRRHALAQTLHPSRPVARATSPGSHERTLATAVDDFRIGQLPFNHIPSAVPPPIHSSQLRATPFQPLDPSSPLLIPDPAPVKPLGKTNPQGIPGETEDMLPVFDACLRVGKLERAALVLKRLNTTGILSVEELILLNNRYLQTSLAQMRVSPNRKQAEGLHQWYQMQIRNLGLPHTTETIACMLKASLLSERGERLVRLVKRYMGMAPGEAGLQVLGMADILSDQDLAVITSICPTYNLAETHGEELEATDMGDAANALSSSVDVESARAHSSAPELVPTPQRGEGLQRLRTTLRLLHEIENVDISKLPEGDRKDIQLRLERESVTSALAKWRSERSNLQQIGITTAVGMSSSTGSLSRNMASWLSDMETQIKNEFALVEQSESKQSKSELDISRCLYGPFIQQSEPARLAAVTILAVLSLGSYVGADRGIPVANLVTKVAKLAHDDIQHQQQEQAQKRRRRRSRVSLRKNQGGRNHTEETPPTISEASAATAAAALEENLRKPWSMQIKAQVGSLLVKLLIQSAKVNVEKEHPASKELVTQSQPAFTHVRQPRRGKKVGVLFLNPHLIEQLKKEPVGDFIAKHLPMVSEPKPWSRFHEGGFLASRTNLVRLKPGDVEQKLYTNAAIRNGDLDQVFKGLDILGKTAWRVNQDVLNVMMEAWNTGEEIANMPPLHPQLEIPAEPDSSADPLLRRQWVRAVKAVENERSGLHSQRCFMNLQLEIARAFRNQTIYFPHNVDYRGRAYPIPTYLNHMGADHTRGLLKFAQRKKLGVKGLRWLKIHLANVYGLDKASFDEREAFANQNLDNIIESATTPLHGSRWWLKGEEPWQCLAVCFELKAAHELSDPTEYLSGIPVQQDGTCNGLQHYAALGGDIWGAKQVNLEPGDRPADVYSAVAELVKQAISKEAAAKNRMAEIMDGKITRKVVKQTVMTNVYGVTFAGGKKQVCKQIDALYPNLGAECGIPNLLLASYVAKHIFQALASMFRGAHDIQYWLGEVGGRVCRALTPSQLQHIADSESKNGGKGASKSKKQGFDDLMKNFRSTVVWTTPLRMPVAQPYRKQTRREVKTCLQSVAYYVQQQTDPVNRRKQLQGFPPNFIHSLDASHMLLSAIHCREQGLEFAAVHDSFWTHAADVDAMNGVLRDAFIDIHEEDVIGRLAAEFDARHGGSLYLASIDPQTAVAKELKAFRKRAKLSPKEELLLEYKRVSLLRSESVEDQEAGKLIVTPGSIYESMSEAEEDVQIKEDMEGMALGSMNEPAPLAEEDLATVATESISTKGTESTMEASERWLHKLEEDPSDFEKALLKGKKSTVNPKSQTVPVWLPLTIPDVPKKGDFDVRRLRESKYFFS